MLTLTQAAAQLGLDSSTLRRQISRGKLRAKLIGKTYVVTEREVERYRSESLGRRRRKPTRAHDDDPARLVRRPPRTAPRRAVDAVRLPFQRAAPVEQVYQ